MKVMLLFSALASTAALAIPEPYFMRTSELAAILNSATVKRVIQSDFSHGKGSGFVDALLYAGTTQGLRLYNVRTGNCTLRAQVKRVLKPGTVGPGEIVLTHAQQLECSSQD
jgi:hypothetical protein